MEEYPEAFTICVVTCLRTKAHADPTVNVEDDAVAKAPITDVSRSEDPPQLTWQTQFSKCWG